MGFFGDLFGGGQEEAYKQVAQRIQQGMEQGQHYAGEAENALSPYLGDPRLQRQYESAIGGGEDFQGLLDKLIGGFQGSPYAKYLTEAMQKAIQNAATSSGMHNSGQELQELQQNASGIASGDLNNYLMQALGLRSDYLNRLGGIAGNESQQQYGAHLGQSDIRNTLGQNIMGQYGKLGEAEGAQKMAHANFLQNLLGGAATLGGSIFGGPIGGAIGAGASHLFGR